jgi:hypothetical protein
MMKAAVLYAPGEPEALKGRIFKMSPQGDIDLVIQANHQ